MAKPRPPGQKLSDTNPEAGPPASMKTPDNSLVSGPTFHAQKQPLAVKKTMLMGMEVMTEPIEGGSAAMAEAKKLAESETGWYEQVRLLGEGGMGAVFEYRMKKFSSRGDKVADEPKAVKVVKFDDLLGNLEGEARDNAREELYKRFIVEVQIAYKLNHENIVRIEGFGEDFGKDNHPYYVMEFLKGQDLSNIIQQNGPLPWKQALPIMRQACEGLEYAHNYVETDDTTKEEKKRPVVHRDIKPENLFIVTDNLGKQKVKILDFGIAKVVEESGKDPTHGSGIVVGTPLYMAPEQAFGGTIDVRTDVYGLGSTMYHVLTERTVFLGDTVNEVMAKLVSEERAVPLRERRPDLAIPVEAEQIIMKCIQKDPADRYQSMRDLWEDLRQREEMGTMELNRLQSGELSPAQSGEFAVDGNGVRAVNVEHPSHSLSQFGSVQVESPRKKRLGLIAGLVGVAAAGTITAAVLMNRSPNDEVKKTPASATRVVHDAEAPMPEQKDARVKIVHVPPKEKERTVTFVTKLEGVQVFKGKELLCTTTGKEGSCTIKLEKNKRLKVVLKKKGYKNKIHDILKDARGGASITMEKRWSSRRRRRRRRNMGVVISKPE